MAHDEASKTIQVVSMTLPVTRKKLGCTNQPKATMATRCLSSFLKRSTRSAVRFSSIRSQMLDLKNMMKKISKVAGFSTINTNHSIRVTAITLWSNGGVLIDTSCQCQAIEMSNPWHITTRGRSFLSFKIAVMCCQGR